MRWDRLCIENLKKDTSGKKSDKELLIWIYITFHGYNHLDYDAVEYN